MGIPISGMMYYCNWVLTTAQLELIAADVSVVDYGHVKEKRKKGEFDDTQADEASVKKAAREWTERYGDGDDAGKNLSIGDILGGGMTANVGVKVTE